MDPVQELIALEALKRLKARYFYTVDTRDCEGWLALWAPDGWFQYEQAVSAGGQDGRPGEKFVGKNLRRIFDELPVHLPEQRASGAFALARGGVRNRSTRNLADVRYRHAAPPDHSRLGSLSRNLSQDRRPMEVHFKLSEAVAARVLTLLAAARGITMSSIEELPKQIAEALRPGT